MDKNFVLGAEIDFRQVSLLSKKDALEKSSREQLRSLAWFEIISSVPTGK